jgi:hypothetical protein
MSTINQGDGNTGVEIKAGDHSPVTINLPPRESAPKQDWVQIARIFVALLIAVAGAVGAYYGFRKVEDMPSLGAEIPDNNISQVGGDISQVGKDNTAFKINTGNNSPVTVNLPPKETEPPKKPGASAPEPRPRRVGDERKPSKETGVPTQRSKIKTEPDSEVHVTQKVGDKKSSQDTEIIAGPRNKVFVEQTPVER